MKVIYPPSQIDYSILDYQVFLAGSIEMGAAEDWQSKVISLLEPLPGIIYNPRRDTWDSSWKQEIDNPQFNEQVTWELDALDASHTILMYFDPNTKSPISLLELGLFAETGKLLVFCPEGFWRKGNVDFVCARYEIKQVKNFEEFVNYCRAEVELIDIVDSICDNT
jgi:hypothetical protein